MAHCPRSRSGLTLVQLIWLIAGTGVLAALLYPVFQDAREHCAGCGRSCISQLQQLGFATMMYVQDYDDCYPASRANLKSDWSVPVWSAGQQGIQHLYNCSPWVAQLLPYTKSQGIFCCPQDANPERDHTRTSTGDLATAFPVSYGPNRMFVSPAAYGRKKPVATSSMDEPSQKYLLGDCVTASGFDLDTIAYLRYPNYAPSARQNGWSLEQFTAAGRVARPEREAEPLTRHQLGSNIAFADGHVKWLRHDQIPNNDGPHGKQFRELKRHVVP
jgi:prepilin-type processing-associated H-X9-DG protein